ncbi:MAG TPA: winged helix-turn-helix domain-containing protein [Bryobacteraceae bacterium]|jgi:DNA-binding winged helix-turn-helix (wHTH) protein
MDRDTETLEGVPLSTEVVRFGAFALNLHTGELRKHGVRVRLQGKPFQILRALLERPGHVVTREELRERLWSSDTFVDFESGLNTAMNRLRITLGDSAENPMYVETIARLGYRFIAPAEHAQLPVTNPQNGPGSSLGIAPAEQTVLPKPARLSDRILYYAKTYWPAIVSVPLLLATGIAAFQTFHSREPELSFQQVTFRKGFATGARFMPDGKSIVYSARWNDAPSRLFRTDGAGEQPLGLGLQEAWLAGFPSRGEVGFFTMSGTPHKSLLEAEPSTGGAPRVISDHAKEADWARNGQAAIIATDDSYYSIQYPPGYIIYRSTARLSDLRISPRGDRIAFAEHPVALDDGGRVMLLEVSSKEARSLSSGWASIEGLAWPPSEHEVWFTAARSGIERSLMAAAFDGHIRTVAQMPGGMELRDISPSGRVLIDRSTQRMTMTLGSLNRAVQEDISWLDWSRAVAISADGDSVLFDESGGGGGVAYSVFIDRAGSEAPLRIGSGRAMDLSPDGRWVLAQDAQDPTRLTLISADGAKSEPVQGGGITYRWLKFLPGNQDILIAGSYPNQPRRLYRQHLPDGRVTLVSPDAPSYPAVLSPDGRTAVSVDDGRIVLIDLLRGTKRFVPLLKPAYPVVFSGNDEVLMSRVQDRTIMLDKWTVTTGHLTPFKRIEMTDTPGILETLPVYVSRNLRSFVYSRVQSLSNLFVVTGWK